MKRAAALLMLVCLASACVLCAPVMLRDTKSLAMGHTGMSSFNEAGSYFLNPAALYYKSDSSLVTLSGSFSDCLDTDALRDGLPNAALTRPTASGSASFTGKYAAVSVRITNILLLDSYPDDSSGRYNAYNVSDLQLTVAYGWSSFAAGFSVNGGNLMTRENLTIRRTGAFYEYLLKTYFERYYHVLGSEYVSFAVGLMGRIGPFTLALTLDDLTKVTSSSMASLSMDAMLSTMNFGVRYSGSRYNTRTTGLIPVVPFVSIELHNAFTDTVAGTDAAVELPGHGMKQRRTELCAGLELMVQLSSRLSVSLMGGFCSGGIGPLFFRGGSHSLGLGMKGNNIQAQIFAEIPISMYFGTGDVCIGLSGSVSF